MSKASEGVLRREGVWSTLSVPPGTKAFVSGLKCQLCFASVHVSVRLIRL